MRAMRLNRKIGLHGQLGPLPLPPYTDHRSINEGKDGERQLCRWLTIWTLLFSCLPQLFSVSSCRRTPWHYGFWRLISGQISPWKTFSSNRELFWVHISFTGFETGPLLYLPVTQSSLGRLLASFPLVENLFQASNFHFSLRFGHVELCSWRDFGSFLEKMTLLFCKLTQADQVETARCWDLRLSKSVNIWELWLQGSLHVAWLVWRSWLRVLIVFGSKHVRPDRHFCTVRRL